MHRQVDRDQCPASGALTDRDRTRVFVHDSSDDGESESGASSVPVSCVVEPGESLEDALPIVGVDAGAVVRDRQDERVERGPESDELVGFVEVPESLGPKPARVAGWIVDGLPLASARLTAIVVRRACCGHGRGTRPRTRG